MNSRANEEQVAGNHYRSSYQHWDFVHDVLYDDYLLGQATKYLTRWEKKNGVEDLRKSKHYVEKLIERWESAHDGLPMATRHFARGLSLIEVTKRVEDFISANFKERGFEASMLLTLATWGSLDDLKRVVGELNALINHLSTGGSK